MLSVRHGLKLSKQLRVIVQDGLEGVGKALEFVGHNVQEIVVFQLGNSHVLVGNLRRHRVELVGDEGKNLGIEL